MRKRTGIASLLPNILSGFLVLAPIFLALLLLIHGMQAVSGIVQPIADLLPGWIPAEELLALVLVLALCFVVGLMVQTRIGAWLRDWIENRFLVHIPGYTMFRDFAAQLAGDTSRKTWKPVLAQFDDGLVPAFLIEEMEDGRCTIFVPAVPTPFAGAVYIFDAHRVHAVNIALPRALQTVSKWGEGASEWVKHLEPPKEKKGGANES
jgi:uncharacterized membrane protein